MLNNHYDVIIIGSGVGGLTSASILAQQGKSVLVLEKHYIAGGLTHTYKRLGVEWDTGVHYVGEVHETSNPFRILFDYITNSQLHWDQMPALYDRIVFPDRDYTFVSGRENFRSHLKESFSIKKDCQAIDAYMQLLSDVGKAGRNFCQAQSLPLWSGSLPFNLLRRAPKRFYNTTTYSALSKLTSNQKLIGVLCGQYGNYGLPPKQSSFFTHALVAKHYLEGGNFPQGGSQEISKNIINVIEKNGGAIRLKSEVKEILLKGNKAHGVELASGEVITAPVVISSCGAHNTFLRLLPENTLPADLYKSVQATRYTTGYFSLNVAINGNSQRLGLPRENHWIYPSYDHDENVQRFFANQSAELPIAYISFASSKDSKWNEHSPEKSTINILGVSSYKWFEQWACKKSRAKDNEYQELKSQISSRYLEKLFGIVPSLKNHLDRCESATPLTMQKYCNYQHGEAYGLEPTPARFNQRWLRAQTPIKGLYLTGQDILFAGVCGALMSGAITALCVSPLKTGKTLKKIGFFDAKN